MRRRTREERRKRIINYFIEHPDASWLDVRKDGLSYDLKVAYDWKTRDARRDAQLEKRKRRKRRVISYLKEHPDATTRDVREAGLRPDMDYFFSGITDARKAAGLISDDYMRGSKAANELKLSPWRISVLVEEGKLPGYRLGKHHLYVLSSAVDERKKMQESKNIV